MPDRIETPPTPNAWGLYSDELKQWSGAIYDSEEDAAHYRLSWHRIVRLVPAGSEVEAVLGVLRERHRAVVDELANADNRTAFGNASIERARIEDAMDLLNQLDDEGR